MNAKVARRDRILLSRSEHKNYEEKRRRNAERRGEFPKLREKLPKTSEEWQEVVDGAQAMLNLVSLRAYGLITGCPAVNVAQCQRYLELGQQRGYSPNQESAELITFSFLELSASNEGR